MMNCLHSRLVIRILPYLFLAVFAFPRAIAQEMNSAETEPGIGSIACSAGL